MANFTVDTAADIPSQNGAVNWWDSLFNGTLPTNTGGGNTGTGSGLSGLFGANAPTGPSLPAGTVSPISDMFSQVPTGLANNPVTYQANNVTSDPGQLALPTGSQWTPRPGYSIVYGVRQGAWGHYQIPDADLPNALQKYGIQTMGAPLNPDAIAYHNNPRGGATQVSSPGTAAGGNNTPPGGGPVVTTPPPSAPPPPPSGGTDNTTPPPTPPPPQLPALDAQRQAYLTAIDNYIKSQSQYQYAPTITDEMRRAMNLPGMAELQMNQQANPTFNAANFVGLNSKDGLPFIPGSAPPQGFKWKWVDPDGANGPAPANYALTPSQDIFNQLPGTELEDLSQIMQIFNDPKYANKYLSKDNLGVLSNFLLPGQNGQRASLAPQDSISQLYPLMQREDVANYVNSLSRSVAGQLGSGYGPNYNVFNDISDPTKVRNYLNATNNALSLNNLPSLSDVLRGGSRTIGNDQFYQGKALDFYSPQENAPAFFQYLLGDFDGSGANPETYGLRMKGAPQTKFDAEQILETLNNSKFKGMFPTPPLSNINQNIFSQALNTSGDSIWTLLNAYKFPGGNGGPANNNNQSFQSTGNGAPGGAPLPSVGYDTMVTQQSGAQERAARDAADASRISLYGGTGTGNLNTTPAPTTTPTTPTTTPTTTNPGSRPDPFAGINAPATSGRPPKFYSPWSPWT